MQKTLRIGVLGCGYWGSKHVRVLASLPNIDLVLIDRDSRTISALAATYPAVQTARALEDVAGSLDGVVVASPPTTHYQLARQALDAGLHTLVEKPMTTTVEHAIDLVEVAAAKNLRLMVGHTFEFNPAVWELATTIRSPEFGKVRYVNSSRLNLGLYQSDTDVIWDLAPHDVSILNYILDARPTSVSAWGLNLMSSRADVAYLSLRYEQIDVSACIHVSWLDPMKVRRTTVVGEHAMVVYDDVATEERLRVYDKAVTPSSSPDAGHPLSYRIGSIVSPYIDFKEPLQLELSAFVEAIRTGRDPEVDGRRGLDVVAVLSAAEESLNQGGVWIDVPHSASLIADEQALKGAA